MAAAGVVAEPKIKYDRQLRYCVIESKPGHFLDNLRLQNPWAELKQFAKSVDICDKDPVVHKHTPYIVILVRLAEKWADAHDGSLPSTRQEKREFKMKKITKKLLNLHIKSVTPGISDEIRQIIADNSTEISPSSSDFWILVAAMKLVTKQFVPLGGTFIFNGIDLKSQVLAL